MTARTSRVSEWEAVEIQRSARAAKRRDAHDLRVAPDILSRYENPPAATCFPLEYAYHLLGDVRGKCVLDYGCGAGDNTVLLARRGARVTGINISPELIELARKRVGQHGLGGTVQLKVASAHDLPLDDDCVDVVFGIAILHHLDLDLASSEVFRVLKPGGRAIFMEPVRNSRAVRSLRGLVPYRDPDASPFERPLTDKQIKGFSAPFTSCEARAFSLPPVNLVRFLRLPRKIVRATYRLDGIVLRALPRLGWYASVRVIHLRK